MNPRTFHNPIKPLEVNANYMSIGDQPYSTTGTLTTGTLTIKPQPKTRIEIITDLLDKRHITAEEAVILLQTEKEYVYLPCDQPHIINTPWQWPNPGTGNPTIYRD